jgi:hypothetical protein
MAPSKRNMKGKKSRLSGVLEIFKETPQMKRNFVLSICLAAALSFFICSNVSADLLDCNIGEMSGPGPSDPGTELAWLKSLPGVPETTVFLFKEEDYFKGIDLKSLSGFDPKIAWDYAVVKWATNWTAYFDCNEDDLLHTGVFAKGVSHVSFFGSEGGPKPVTEPATMVLLGIGLIAIAGFGRKKFKF